MATSRRLGKKWSSVTCCNQLLNASGVVIKISSLRWWVKVLSASECLVSWAGAANGYARVAPEEPERAGQIHNIEDGMSITSKIMPN
jgi:hypothetical protein